jgi:2-polyprenyl-3-methyl-5-hydroxy-6-metoxy-1,4-benzoquinol methylase
MVTQLFECRQKLERVCTDRLNLQAEVKKSSDECTNTAAAWRDAEVSMKIIHWLNHIQMSLISRFMLFVDSALESV